MLKASKLFGTMEIIARMPMIRAVIAARAIIVIKAFFLENGWQGLAQ